MKILAYINVGRQYTEDSYEATICPYIVDENMTIADLVKLFDSKGDIIRSIHLVECGESTLKDKK